MVDKSLLADVEDSLDRIITDSIDVDWTPRDAARAIVRQLAESAPDSQFTFEAFQFLEEHLS